MKFPFYHQIESRDCGVSCIQMVAAYYKKKYSLDYLKELCETTRLGISIKDIINVSTQIGLKAVAINLTLEKLSSFPLPIILHWKEKHFVVLFQIKKEQYYIADPAFGKIKLSKDSFIRNWNNNHHNGIAIAIAPTEQFYKNQPPKRSTSHTTLKYLSQKIYTGNKKRFLIVTILSLLGLSFNWFIPILFQKMVDQGINGKNITLVIAILIAQLAFFVGNFIASWISSIILSKTNFFIGLSFLSDYVNKLVKLPIAFYDTKINSDLIERINDHQKVHDFITYNLTGILFNILNLCVFSSQLFYFNPNVFFTFFLFSSIATATSFLFINKRKHINYSLFSLLSENRNIIHELIMGMAEIKINNAGPVKISIWKKTLTHLKQIEIQSLKLNYKISFSASFFNRFKDILIIGGCSYLIINDKLSLGVLISINYILGQLSTPINQIAEMTRNYQDIKLSYQRLSEIQKRKDEIDNKSSVMSPILKQGFEINHISFKYEGSYNNYILKDISIQIPLKKVTAIVGASGSGKTTLMKLLLSFYHPQEGNIYINNENLRDINADDFRKRCGVVMQDGYIFSGSIAENIALADANPSISKVQEAAHIACIKDFIESLPLKYDTPLGNNGINLSGGQKQRLLIARAIYRNPEFIFLDEATSSLDANYEKEIMTNLHDFYKGKTVVIIAHRLSTVKEADNIIVLEQGKVLEQGNHKTLTQLKGRYYELVKNQLELGNN